MAIYLTGDTHAALDIGRLSEETWEERDWRPSEGDYLIVLGDVGCVWHTKRWDLPELDERDREVIDILCSQPWTVLFVDGNHENHDTLADMEAEMWHGGLVHRVAPRLLHLMRGQVFDIDGTRVFCMGGAHSPDWMYREEGKDWWPDEMPAECEYDDARRNLAACGMTVDLIATHTCPSSFLGEVLDQDEFAEPDEFTDFLDWAYELLDFKTWCFGHFHEELFSFSDARLFGLFESIVELDPETGAVEEVG